VSVVTVMVMMVVVVMPMHRVRAFQNGRALRER
jgi:hypothetical protein